MTAASLLLLLGGLLVGLLAGWFYGYRQRAALASRLQVAEALAIEQQKHHDATLVSQRQQYEATLAAQRQQHDATLVSQRQQFEAALATQKQHFEAVTARVEAQLRSATEEMLRQREQEFAQSSKQNLGQIVDPLRETIDKMQKAIADNTLQQAHMGGSLKTTIEAMMRQSEATKVSTDELARVFKHQSKVQGDWGETLLDELLKAQGLTPGIHYDTQATIRNAEGQTVRSDEGSLMRPDVILHLDTQREVIIDSKVSLTAFFDYVNAEDVATRELALKAHVQSLQKHVKELSVKDYASYIQPPKVKMDYVIMFVPHTGALWTALNAQPNLWRKAMEQNVYIADEQTLMAALRIIHLTWTQIIQTQNHEKVYALASEMINRVGQYYKTFLTLGRNLKSAQASYEDCEKKLQDHGQSIIVTCNKLQKLGARQSDKNPVPEITAE